MDTAHATPPAIERRVFATWSIEIPAWFAETFVTEGGYWHAWDDMHSVSLSSIELSARQGSVSAAKVAADMRDPGDGPPVERLPPGLEGWAVEMDAIPPAVASRAISGMLAAERRVLVVTITSDDMDWAYRTFLSIRYRPVRRSAGTRPRRTPPA